MDEYRLLTRRDGKQDGNSQYLTEASFNGQKIDAFSRRLRDTEDEQRLTQVKYLERHPNIQSVAFIISGENLK